MMRYKTGVSWNILLSMEWGDQLCLEMKDIITEREAFRNDNGEGFRNCHFIVSIDFLFVWLLWKPKASNPVLSICF